jgi:uncharacterized protein (TIGR02118 family)
MKGIDMIKVTILYPKEPGSHFDADYYLNVHMPMAIKLLGAAIKSVSAEIGIAAGTPGQEPPFAALVGFTCDTVQAFTEASMPHMATLQADIPNYTDIEPIFQISEIRLSK